MPLTYCALLLEIGVFVVSSSTTAVSLESRPGQDQHTTIVTLGVNRTQFAKRKTADDVNSNDNFSEDRLQTSVITTDPQTYIHQTPVTLQSFPRITKALRSLLANNRISHSSSDQPSVFRQQLHSSPAQFKNRPRRSKSKKKRRKKKKRKKKKAARKNDRGGAAGGKLGTNSDKAGTFPRAEITLSRAGLQRQHGRSRYWPQGAGDGQHRKAQQAPETQPTESRPSGALRRRPQTLLTAPDGRVYVISKAAQIEEQKKSLQNGYARKDGIGSSFPAKHKQATDSQRATSKPDQKAGKTHEEKIKESQPRRTEPTRKTLLDAGKEGRKLTHMKSKSNQRHGFDERIHSIKITKENQQLVRDTEGSDENSAEPLLKTEPKAARVKSMKKMQSQKTRHPDHNGDQMAVLSSVVNHYSSELSKQEAILNKIIADTKQAAEFLNNREVIKMLDSASFSNNREHAEAGAGSTRERMSDRNSNTDGEKRSWLSDARPEEDIPSTERHLKEQVVRKDEDVQTGKGQQEAMHRINSNAKEHFRNLPAPEKITQTNISNTQVSSGSNAALPYDAKDPTQKSHDTDDHSQDSESEGNNIQIEPDISVLNHTHLQQYWPIDGNTKSMDSPGPGITTVTKNQHSADTEAESQPRHPSLDSMKNDSGNQYTPKTHRDKSASDVQHRFSSEDPSLDMTHSTFVTERPRGLAQQQMTWTDDIKQTPFSHNQNTQTDQTSPSDKHTDQSLSMTFNKVDADKPKVQLESDDKVGHNQSSNLVLGRKLDTIVVNSGGAKDLKHLHHEENRNTTAFKQVQPTFTSDTTHLEMSPFTKDFRNGSQFPAYNGLNIEQQRNADNADVAVGETSQAYSDPSAHTTELVSTEQPSLSSDLTLPQMLRQPAVRDQARNGLEGQSDAVRDMTQHQLRQSDTSGTSGHLQSVGNGDAGQSGMPVVNSVNTEGRQHVVDTDAGLSRQPMSAPETTAQQERLSNSAKKNFNGDPVDTRTLMSSSADLQSLEQDATRILQILLKSDSGADDTLQHLLIRNSANAAQPKTDLHQEPAWLRKRPVLAQLSSAVTHKTDLKKEKVAAVKDTGDDPSAHDDHSLQVATSVNTPVKNKGQIQKSRQSIMQTKSKQKMHSHHTDRRRRPVQRYKQHKHSLPHLLASHSPFPANSPNQEPAMDDRRDTSLLEGRSGTLHRIVSLPLPTGMDPLPLTNLFPVEGTVNSSLWIGRSGITAKENDNTVLKQRDNSTSFLGIDFISYRALVTSVGLGTTLLVFCCFLCVCGLARWHRLRQYRKAFSKLEKGFSDLDTDRPFYLRLARLRRSPTGNQYVVTIVNESKFSVVEHDLESEEEIFDVMDIDTADKKGPLSRLQWTNQSIPF